MKLNLKPVILFIACFLIVIVLSDKFLHFSSNGDYKHLYPKVCVCVNILPGEYVLSHFMGLIEDLRYPKDRIHISLFAFAEPNNSVTKWIENLPQLYKSTFLTPNDGNWMEESLVFGRQHSCDFVLVMDTDAFLLRDSLRQLVNFNKVVVSPLLTSPFDLHSNVHNLLGIEFVQREQIDFVRVYYSRGPLLVNLRHKDSSYLTFSGDNLSKYDGPDNPIDVFAHSAYSMGIPILFSNHHHYGYLIDSTLHTQTAHMALFSTYLADWVSNIGPMAFPTSAVLSLWYPISTKVGFDEIYLVNLARRPERLEKMREMLKLLGIAFTRFEAVDGSNLTGQEITHIHFMPGYMDPYHKRPMKFGEIGCFLSHFKIWQEIIEKMHDKAIVLEDDVRFTGNGTLILKGLIEDLLKTRLDWDFIYLGRKKMSAQGDEFFVPGHRYLSTVGYSYWSIGYMISQQGARKMLAAKPLDRMMALDEFLPIMYDKHPNKQWSAHFASEKLRAFAAYPSVIEPEKYSNQPGYVSDTETSMVVVGTDFGAMAQREFLLDSDLQRPLPNIKDEF